jgi:hypothetical protein
MSAHLLTDETGRIAAVLIAVALASTAKALALVLRTWIEQAARTRRLARSLEGTKPGQRPKIIQACSQLEGRSTSGSSNDEPESSAQQTEIEHA